MKNAKLAKPGKKNLAPNQVKMTERELLAEILKLNAMFLSKMFEFMRAYQDDQDWGRSNRLRDSSGRDTRLARLFREVNKLGIALNQTVAAYTDEELHEKRDAAGRVIVFCNQCGKETSFARVTGSPHGIAGAYMDGSERLICLSCKKETIYPDDSAFRSLIPSSKSNDFPTTQGVFFVKLNKADGKYARFSTHYWNSIVAPVRTLSPEPFLGLKSKHTLATPFIFIRSRTNFSSIFRGIQSGR